MGNNHYKTAYNSIRQRLGGAVDDIDLLHELDHLVGEWREHTASIRRELAVARSAATELPQRVQAPNTTEIDRLRTEIGRLRGRLVEKEKDLQTVLEACWWSEDDGRPKPYCCCPSGIIHRAKPRFVIPLNGGRIIESTTELAPEQIQHLFNEIAATAFDRIVWIDMPSQAFVDGLRRGWAKSLCTWFILVEAFFHAQADRTLYMQESDQLKSTCG